MKVAQVFAERYELVEVLGAGGTGSVWRAVDSVLEREVALKILRVGGADDETMRARLRTEARLAGSLAHPGIGAVYDYGECSDGPYIVMAVVPGETFSAVLRRERILSAERVMSIVAQLATALAAAHEAGIIHRDLKPGNVMLTEDDQAVLVDFGIARSPDYEPLTVTGTVVGTVDYVSPEQIAGGSATFRSDLYSLGMLAYEALSGRKPFRRESPVATALAHLQEEAPPLGPEVPESVRVLVARMMAKDPDDRPHSAAQVAELAAAALQAPDDVTDALGFAPLGPTPAAKKPSRAGRRGMLVAAMTTVLAMVGFFGFQDTGQTADAVTRHADSSQGEAAQPSAPGARSESVATTRTPAAASKPETTSLTDAPTPTTSAPPRAGRSGGGGSSTANKPRTAAPPSTGDRASDSGKKHAAPGKSKARGKGKKK